MVGRGGGRSKIAIGLMPNNVWRFTKRVRFDSRVSLEGLGGVPSGYRSAIRLLIFRIAAVSP